MPTSPAVCTVPCRVLTVPLRVLTVSLQARREAAAITLQGGLRGVQGRQAVTHRKGNMALEQWRLKHTSKERVRGTAKGYKVRSLLATQNVALVSFVISVYSLHGCELRCQCSC